MATATRILLRISEARELAASGRGRAIRLRAGLGVSEVAQALGIDPATLWRWETGRTRPAYDDALRYAELLDTLAADAERRTSGSGR